YSIAYARGSRDFGVYAEGDERKLPQFLDNPDFQVRLRGKVSTGEADRVLLLKAIKYYRNATALAPKTGLYWLGLGWMCEEGMFHAAELGPPPFGGPGVDTMSDEDFARISLLLDALAVEEGREDAIEALAAELPAALPLFKKVWDARTSTPEIGLRMFLRRAWGEEALFAYRHAHNLTYDKAKRTKYGGQELRVATESAQGIGIVLAEHEGAQQDKRERRRMAKRVKELAARPRTVTPVIFSLTKSVAMKELLAPDKKVAFDLDGDGEARSWPWVRPGTGILVWDPANTGRVASGRQMFGSVTWWVFWRDGYHAMAALDDNGDGGLAGDELRGLSVWHDANGNGVSDAGEVTPVRHLGIARLAVRAEGVKNGAAWHSRGVVLNDGRAFPTYDWTPKSAE
ncbi:MAG: hypothetical protein GY851_00945, partial [bacterium]|nr:hypothetical protein [bacterium]